MNDATCLTNVIPDYVFANLTDEELLATKLSTEDPRAEASIAGKFPEHCNLEAVLKSYNFREQKLPCAMPGCTARHHKGFLVQAGQEKGLIGKDCGKKHFGDSWDEYHQALADAKNRQNALLRKDNISKILTEDSIKSIRAFRVYFSEIDAEIRLIRDFIPKIFSEIIKNVSRGKYYLFIEEKLDNNSRDYVASQGSKISDFREIILHTFPSSDIYLYSFRRRAEKSISLIDDYYTVMKENSISISKMKIAIKNLNTGVGELIELFKKIPNVQHFFSFHNMAGITKWSQMVSNMEKIELSPPNQIKKIISSDEDTIERVIHLPSIKEINHNILYDLSDKFSFTL
ncbi:hypothetical protein [Acetobacter oryzoeni]|uniref:Uncharacterized protein n=1 Tax=Acetobacter oryzoeni TaxID=2500548 RepID=A0A5B9GLD8_9PROT|nr:hypothetical protein [Acetobacter oryzoeni]MCP1203788.1 hypothetical protein [Acetobacter oryzoeni]QEE86903.1 hypothetical protein EOV40_014425 [Acetobacter oryzoeni]